MDPLQTHSLLYAPVAGHFLTLYPDDTGVHSPGVHPLLPEGISQKVARPACKAQTLPMPAPGLMLGGGCRMPLRESQMTVPETPSPVAVATLRKKAPTAATRTAVRPPLTRAFDAQAQVQPCRGACSLASP